MVQEIIKRPVLITPAGERRQVMPANGTDFSLEEAQKLVEGYVQLIPIEEDVVLLMNEEGKLRGLPVNHPATEEFANRLNPGDYIVGNVVLCPVSYFQ